MFSRCGGCFSDAVAIFSGEVINGENEQILRFFCEFCRGDGEESFYGDDFLKYGFLWSRSSQDGGC
jgi:hypothetical protein